MRMTTPQVDITTSSKEIVVPEELLSTNIGTKPTVVTPSPTAQSTTQSTDDVVKMGYLKKFKGKKKWFVVRRESESGPARLEYYAKERYFRAGQQPRRNICLKACFNINRTESKVKWAIALHTHNDCLRIVFGSEEEMKEWLQLLNSLAGTEEEPSEDMPIKPHFEHVWVVHALNKGLGSKEGILGPYRLCLTSRELTLLKVGEGDERNTLLKFPLNVIRSVSHDSTFGCFFHIEFGRSAVTGPGQLSLRTEDNNIAQNMHLLILKAMQNYSKEEMSHREVPRRGRTYTWNSGYSDSASRPPSYVSQTPPVMTRIQSMDSGIPRTRTESINSTDSRTGPSPPISISATPPTISFFSPLCSTTDSASSSYSYENNNNREPTTPTQGEPDSYVPWNPSEEPSISLPLQPLDTADYVTTGGQAATSSYMDMQSPISPYTSYNNYVPMSISPGGSKLLASCDGISNGKLSVSHSRNSSLLEDLEGYVPMLPGENAATTPMSNGMGSGSNIDSYLEMDLSHSSRMKANHSNDDRSLPASSIESLQSRTPSSDFPLEKVSSYFLPSDENEDSAARPVRCFSVGSRSDTGTTLKSRYGKNRLEAVQETFRMRALSCGAKNPRTGKPFSPFSPPPLTPQNTSPNSSTSSVCLSSSWSGSGSTTGRWAHLKSQISPASSQIPNDSDLMELDFSHNRDKKPGTVRRKSLSGIREQSTSISSTKTSPSPSQSKGTLADSPDPYMSMEIGGAENSKYASSAPIAIQKASESILIDDGGVPLVSRLTSLDLNPLHNAKEEYMSMDFAPVVAKTLDKVPPAPFTLTQESSLSLPSQPMLSRIEESPENSISRSRRTLQNTIQEESNQSAITYADVEHPRTGGAHPLSSSTITSSFTRPSYPAVNYSQINFKSAPTS